MIKDNNKDRGYVLRFRPDGASEDEYMAVNTFTIKQYQCGLIAGDNIRLKVDLDKHHKGETFIVLTGAMEDPSCLWLEDSSGEIMSWDDEMEIFDSFEKIKH